MRDSALAPWATFYAIAGSSAAVLTGLMFVVITLVTGARVRRPEMGIAAFNTPTVVHFCVALAIAAILTAPWQVLWHAGLLLGLTGLAGLGYSAMVVRRIRQAEYLPVLEDWTWHVAFPLVSYIALVVAALLLPNDPAPTLFLVGAATMLLLFVGIHNAWDNVTYIVVDQIRRPVEDQDEGRSGGGAGGEDAHASHEGAPTTTASLAGAPDDPGTRGRATRAASRRRASRPSRTASRDLGAGSHK